MHPGFKEFEGVIGPLLRASSHTSVTLKRQLGHSLDKHLSGFPRGKIQQKKLVFLNNAVKITGLTWFAAEPHRIISTLKNQGTGDARMASALLFVCYKTTDGFEELRKFLHGILAKEGEYSRNFLPKIEYFLGDLLKDNQEISGSISQGGLTRAGATAPTAEELTSQFGELVKICTLSVAPKNGVVEEKSKYKRKNQIQIKKEKGRNFVETGVTYFLDEKSQFGLGSLAIIDVDDLTKINKVYGENIGDVVLEIVQVILDEIANGVFAKAGICGDDTFYMVLHDKGVYEAKPILEILCDRVRCYDWDFEAHALRVSISIGLSHRHTLESSIDMAIRAGIGMRKAKAEGGNRVVLGANFLPHSNTFTPHSTRQYWS